MFFKYHVRGKKKKKMHFDQNVHQNSPWCFNPGLLQWSKDNWYWRWRLNTEQTIVSRPLTSRDSELLIRLIPPNRFLLNAVRHNQPRCVTRSRCALLMIPSAWFYLHHITVILFYTLMSTKVPVYFAFLVVCIFSAKKDITGSNRVFGLPTSDYRQRRSSGPGPASPVLVYDRSAQSAIERQTWSEKHCYNNCVCKCIAFFSCSQNIQSSYGAVLLCIQYSPVSRSLSSSIQYMQEQHVVANHYILHLISW